MSLTPLPPLFILISSSTATGKWFCAGTDVKARGSGPDFPAKLTVRSAFVPGVALTHLDTSKAVGRVVLPENTSSFLLQIVEHSKVLVAALNGPVMGKCSCEIPPGVRLADRPVVQVSPLVHNFLSSIPEGFANAHSQRS